MTRLSQALLLLGPTGSGKTPLGQKLAARNLRGQPCVHFDFGEHLRKAASARPESTHLSLDEQRFLRNILATGALLEDQDFHIAERILRAFLSRMDGNTNPWIVLNGLPRHTGQAEAVGRIVDIQLVVQLRCTPQVVLTRIRSNQGGDRTDRDDDQIADIQRKLSIFDERTVPLVDVLAGRGAQVVQLDVTESMTPDLAWETLDQIMRPRA